MSRLMGFAVALAMSALAQAAAAQDRVYRCSAEGHSYSQQPCTNGASIEVADMRSAAQVTQAQRVAQRDARLADALVRQRQQAESAAYRQGPILIGAPARVATDATACRANSACGRTERTKQGKHERADRITLYRAPTT
ncbi:MAG TPA: hypothetical protein VLJ62_30660 [Burkholderiaceae bacterium]|nr:hypothetical protein [Burkholderiaceae bacterium]